MLLLHSLHLRYYSLYFIFCSLNVLYEILLLTITIIINSVMCIACYRKQNFYMYQILCMCCRW